MLTQKGPDNPAWENRPLSTTGEGALDVVVAVVVLVIVVGGAVVVDVAVLVLVDVVVVVAVLVFLRSVSPPIPRPIPTTPAAASAPLHFRTLRLETALFTRLSSFESDKFISYLIRS